MCYRKIDLPGTAEPAIAQGAPAEEACSAEEAWATDNEILMTQILVFIVIIIIYRTLPPDYLPNAVTQTIRALGILNVGPQIRAVQKAQIELRNLRNNI